MNNLIPFQFESIACPVRLDENGQPWWVLQDICQAISIQNTKQSAERLRPHEITKLCFTDDGIPRQLLLINESGLYRLIMRSNKPEAERFQDWVCQDVLPALRRTGKYDIGSPVKNPPSLGEIREAMELLESLDQLGDRDRLMLADMVRTDLQRRGGFLASDDSGVSAAGFDIADALDTLAPSLSAKQKRSLVITLGQRIAKEYRDRFRREPGKQTRFVDGKNRAVNWYHAEDADWAYPIIQSFLAGLIQARG